MNRPFSANLPGQPWSFTKKILFRACFLFLALFIFFFPSDVIPFLNPVYDFYSRPFNLFIPWVGRHILHLPYDITIFSNDGADTTFNYLVLLFILVCTLLGSFTWTLIDRRRSSYNTLHYWLTVFVRYYCAFTMFGFGLAKLYRVQFAFPSLSSLLQPLGTYSPMHMAWTFFGYSKAYNYFMGVLEVTGGLLLLFRRTTRLGAIFLLAVMLNVVFINYCFDVCVKIVSSGLVLMALFLLWQERRRLIDFFFRNRPVVAENEWVPRFNRKWINISAPVFKYLLIISTVFSINWEIIGFKNDSGDNRIKSSLHGIYNVQTFVKNDDTLAPLMTDTTRWRRLVITDRGSDGIYASVRVMNDSAKTYLLESDTIAKKITMYKVSDSTKKFYCTYSVTGKDSLHLLGKWNGDSVSVVLVKYNLDNFTLINRGFHFINERGFQK